MSGPKTKLPPTEKQLVRIDDLLDHPAIAPHLDNLLVKMPGYLNTRGGAGWLINWMKSEIGKYEKLTAL